MMRPQRGDTLVEVAIGVALMGVVVIVAFNLANSTFRLAAQGRERTQAAQLAQDQAEKLRTIRDALVAGKDPTTGASLAGTARDYKNDYTKVLVDDAALPGCYTYINDNLSLQSATSGCVSGPAQGYKPLSFYHVTIKAVRSHTTTADNDASNGRINATIDVTWDSIIRNDNNDTNHLQITYALADTRPPQPIDCSVVGTAACQ